MELLIEEGREKQSSVTHLFRCASDESSPWSTRLTCTRSLAAGLATTSHAVQCAEANGIDPRVTQRAAHVSAHIASHAVTELLDAALGERDKSELRATAARVTRFLELDLDALEVADDVHAALGRIVREEMGDDA
jgi:DNA mismatch repair ATPase MutS